MRVAYRLRQGLRDILAFRQTVDMALVCQVLTPAQVSIFCRMTHAEQVHCVNVLRSVLADGQPTAHDLQVAALLHDVGKSRCPLNVAQRSLAVAAHHLLPRLDASLSRVERFDWWRAPFVVRQHHPRWGAELLRMNGGSERAVWLVEHHADLLHKWDGHPYAPLLARLQAADNAN